MKQYLALLLLLCSLALARRIIFPCELADGSPGYWRRPRECPNVNRAFRGKFVCCRDNIQRNIEVNDLGVASGGKCLERWLRGVPYVANGIPTKPQEFPYMVALGWKSSTGNKFDYRCGGVAITYRTVLTAAHCAYIDGIPPVVVLAGGDNLTDSTAKIYNVSEVIVHPAYNDAQIYHDIALIQLETEVNFNVACIWTSNPLIHRNVTAIGYGHTSFAGLASDQLLKAYLEVIPKDICGRFYELDNEIPRGIIDEQMCAQDPERFRDTCQGDSGGPLIMPHGGKSYIVGITSFGQGCEFSPPSVYTRVSRYADWIEKHAITDNE